MPGSAPSPVVLPWLVAEVGRKWVMLRAHHQKVSGSLVLPHEPDHQPRSLLWVEMRETLLA